RPGHVGSVRRHRHLSRRHGRGRAGRRAVGPGAGSPGARPHEEAPRGQPVTGQLEGKVAIVTGAGQGIGRAYALRFVQEDAKVAVADINDENGERVTKELEAAGGEALFVHVDVSDEQSTLDMARTVAHRWGRIDVLVNNAGIYETLNPLDDSLAYLKQVLDV